MPTPSDTAPGQPPEPPRANTVQLRLLGTPAWRAGPGSAWRPLADKDAVLLAELALAGPQPRSALAAWLWPDALLPRAHTNLRQRLFRLRQQLGEVVREVDGSLRLQEAVHCDLTRQGCSPDADLAATLLAGIDPEAASLQAWLDDTRRQWLARRTDLISGLASRHEAAGELAAALALTEGLLATEPLLEHAWRRLMRLHMRRGDRAAALAAFERCEHVLKAELGVRPAPETQALLHQAETASAPADEASTPVQNTLPPGLVQPPPLVGRDAERQAVAQAWALGQPFILIGEAGLGKTRLLLDCAEGGPARVISAAWPGDENVPYAALVRLLRAMHRVAPRPQALWPDDCSTAGAEERRELARLLPELGPAPAAPGLQALLVGAVENVFSRAPTAGVQAVLLDDLQHADEASRYMLYRASGQPGLCWGFATRPSAQRPNIAQTAQTPDTADQAPEPEVAPSSTGPAASDSPAQLEAWLTSSTRVHAVVLGGLTVQALQALLLSLGVPGLASPGLAQALARHCGGNPLFVLETLRYRLLRAAAEPATQAQPGGATAPATATPAGADFSLPLPPSVHTLLQARLVALSPPAQALARVAAVAGADFNADLAADVLQQPVLALAEAWRELEAAQVMRGDSFVHETMLETARAGLPVALQRPLHAQVAHSLQRSQAPARRVAAHFAAGGLPRQAAHMALAAAQQARVVGRLNERVQCLQDAARWFDEAGDTEAAFEAKCENCAALYALSGAGPALALLDQLLARARRRETRLGLQLTRAGVTLSQFDVVNSLAAAEAALALAEPGSTEELSALILAQAARAQQGEAFRERAAIAPLRTRLSALNEPLVATELWGYLALVCTLVGDADGGLHALQMQAQLARQTGKADDETNALTSLVALHAQRGDSERAVSEGQRALALQRRLGAKLNTVGALLNLGLTQIGLHALGDAWQALREAHSGCAGLGEQAAELAHIALDGQAELWLRAGQPQRAWALVEAETPGVTTPRRITRWALRARILTALGESEAAADIWRQVLNTEPGTAAVLRAQWLALLALGAEARHHLPTLTERTVGMPPVLQALSLWVQADAAWQQGRHEAALAGARALRQQLHQARHVQLPEAELRQWLVRCLSATAPVGEAAAEEAAFLSWRQQVWQVGVTSLCERATETHDSL